MVAVPGLGAALEQLVDPERAFLAMTGERPLDWQAPYLWEVRNAVVLKGRQVGASTAASVLVCRRALLVPHSLVAIVSPSLKQSTEVKERSRNGLERLGVRMIKDSESVIQLENRSRILSLPGTAKSVRGWSVDFLVIDEAAFLDPETFLAAHATVAATGGRIVVQSTPAGPFGHFYDRFLQASDLEEAKNDPTVQWVRYQVSSEDVPTIGKDFLETERARLTDDEYAQEYLGQFARPGMGLVDPERLRDLTTDAPSDVWGRLRGA